MTDLDTAQAPPMATGIPTPSDDYATKVFGHISALRPRRRHHKQNAVAATLIIEDGEVYAAACVRKASLANAAQITGLRERLREVEAQRDEAETAVDRLQGSLEERDSRIDKLTLRVRELEAARGQVTPHAAAPGAAAAGAPGAGTDGRP